MGNECLCEVITYIDPHIFNYLPWVIGCCGSCPLERDKTILTKVVVSLNFIFTCQWKGGGNFRTSEFYFMMHNLQSIELLFGTILFKLVTFTS